MIPIVTPAQMAAVDAAAPEPLDVLVGRAAGAVARAALRELGGAYGRTVVLACGPGNNGLDGRVAAQRLRRRGVRTFEFDARDLPASLPHADLVIDAAFGTGYRVGDREPFRFPTTDAAVLAVDIPSGIDGATGERLGAPVAAQATVTFQALKPGLLFAAGPRFAGAVEVVDIGLGEGVAARAQSFLVTGDDVAQWWPRRATDSHKWHHAVRVVAGSDAMPGAAALVASSTGRAGAGYTALTTPGAMPTAVSPEVVLRPASALAWDDEVLVDLHRFSALAIGPGLGRSDATLAAVRNVVTRADLPVVVDADALAAFAADGGRPSGSLTGLAGRTSTTVLTPHDGEYTQLLGAPPGADRIAAAHALAAASGAIVLLKGPTTVVADGRLAYVIDHGDQRLATAGSGDVLTGMIAAGLAAGGEALRTVAAAAWVHADAARRSALVGTVAGDLVDVLPAVFADRLGSDDVPPDITCTGGIERRSGPLHIPGGRA